MITPVEWIGVAAGSSVLSSAVTAVASRRPSMAAVFAENYRDVVERLTRVEARVDSLESELSDERKEHGFTKEALLVARRWIREAVAWATGPRHAEFPTPPADLLKDL